MSWPLRPHSSYVATQCPGDRLREVIAEINAGAGTPPDTGEEFTVGQMEDIAQWEKDTRKIILDVLVGAATRRTTKVARSVGERHPRLYRRGIKASEARIIAAINARWDHWLGGGPRSGVRAPQVRFTRDATIFALGAGAFVFEVVSGGDRPNVLYGALAMMGVAAYLRGTTAKGPPE